MENPKKFDKHDLITPEFLAHYFNAEYKTFERVTFSYVSKNKCYKVVISKSIDCKGWRIWVYYYGIEDSKTRLATINDLITALCLFGVPALAAKIKIDCLNPNSL